MHKTPKKWSATANVGDCVDIKTGGFLTNILVSENWAFNETCVINLFLLVSFLPLQWLQPKALKKCNPTKTVCVWKTGEYKFLKHIK